MNSKVSINQRFTESVNFLISEFKDVNKTSIAEKLKISKSKFSEILNKRMSIGLENLADFTECFNISAEWLLTGKGEMLRTDDAETKLLQFDGNTKINELEDRIKFYKEKIEFVERKLQDCEDEKKRIKTIS